MIKKLGCLLVFIAIAIIAFVTNPSERTHRENALELLQEYGGDEFGINSDYLPVAKELIGADSVDEVIASYINRKNYLFFSLTEIKIGDRSEIVALGLFGTMWDLRTGEDIVNWTKNIIER